MINSPNVNFLKCGYFCIVLIALQANGLAQIISDSTQYYVQHLDSEDGLLHDQLNAFISTDSKGFQWIASSNGVYRFDGKTFTNYLPEEDTLQALAQSSFFEDNLGRVWFSTVNALNYYDYRTDAVTSQVFTEAPNNYLPAYHILHYDSLRDEFLLSNSQDLWSFRPNSSPTTSRITSTSSARFLPLPNASSAMILGFPWLMGPGIERFEIRNGSIVNHSWSKNSIIKKARINGGITDHLGRVWLGTEYGLMHYDVVADTVLGIYPSPDQNSKEIWSPVVFQDKLAVSTAQSGIWLFSPDTGEYEYALASKALETGDIPNKSPRTLHITPEGELFAMCRDEGIDVYNPVPAPAQEAIDSDGKSLSVSALAADQLDQVWVATMEGNLYLYGRDETPKHASKRIFNENNPILKLQAERTKNQVLAQSQFNLFRLTFDSIRRKITLDTIASFEQTIEGFSITSDGNPMVRTRNACYMINDIGVQQIHHRILDRSSSNDLIKLEKDHFAFSPADQWLYILSYSNGKVIILDSIATTGTVWSAKELDNKTYLLGTTNGLISTQEDRTKKLSGEAIYEFTLLNNEPHVALTSNGIMLKEATGKWKQRNREIGLPGRYNDKSSIGVTEKRIWIGSDQGLYRINLPTFNSSSNKTPIPYITSTWINDRPWPRGLLLNHDSLVLSYHENTIEVNVSVVQNVGAVTPDIIYRLTGYQTDWAKLRGGNNIRFTQVPPGAYQLEIALASSKRNTSGATSITVNIQPPYWQTWWFRTLAALTSIGFIASGVGLAYRRRLIKERQKRERERMIAEERDRIGKELHDDLGGELATILFLSQREIRKQPSSNNSRIVELTKASLANMRDIIWALEGNDTTLGGLITYTQRYGTTMCTDRRTNFQLTNKVSRQFCAEELSPKSRRNLFLITKEAINNSLRHSQTPIIELSYAHRDGLLVVAIADTGKGFDLESIQTGNGIKNLQSRTKALNGEYEILSTPGTGTTVLIKVPLA